MHLVLVHVQVAGKSRDYVLGSPNAEMRYEQEHLGARIERWTHVAEEYRVTFL